jgi:hypothetical protein
MPRTNSNQPFDLSAERPDTIEDRVKLEKQALGIVDGHQIRRTGRTIPVQMKMTPVRRKQLQELATRLDTSMTAVVEVALDALEEKLARDQKAA